jgi:hypothetical protein
VLVRVPDAGREEGESGTDGGVAANQGYFSFYSEIFHKKVDGFVSDSQKLILVVEYPLISLKREFHNRLLNKLQFDKEEITRILYSAIRGYAAVERTGGANTKVRMAHIFVGVQARESTVKVIDSALLSAPTNIQCMILHGSHSNEHYDIYPSPE